MREQVLDKGYVDLVDHMGSDLTVCNAARVSFSKETDWEIDRAAEARLKATGSTFHALDLKTLGEKDKKKFLDGTFHLNQISITLSGEESPPMVRSREVNIL